LTDFQIPWGRIELPDSGFIIPLPGEQSVRLRRVRNELIITRISESGETESRFITGNEHSVFLEPGLPDLPVILKPSQYISILPSRKLDAFVEVPFTLRIFFGSKQKKIMLMEIVLKELSRSFFGNPENGEFAYFLESPLCCSIADYSAFESSVYCPLSIVNKSDQNLEFEKMIFRVPYLSIYKSSSGLIGSPVNITFHGQEQISQIVYRKTPPNTVEDSVFLAPPGAAEDKNLIRRSFYFFKNLYTG